MGDVRLWAKKRAASAEQVAKDKAEQLANGDKTGTAKHPFPVADRDAYLASIKGSGIAARTLKAPLVPVRLSELSGTQKTINRERLEAHMENPSMVKPGTLASGSGAKVDAPIVVKKNGQKFIHDGHHRLTVAALRGQEQVPVRLIDLDKGDE